MDIIAQLWDLMMWFWDVVVHLDVYLADIMNDFGRGTYLILFLIIFCETGLVITPFLPGDSLLFAAGALTTVSTASGETPLSLPLLVFILIIAAIAGDSANYALGKFLGPTLHKKGRLPFIKRKHLDRTQAFYDKYGQMTIILARFAPIVRTFAPFLAGVGQMRYPRFLSFNVIGGVVWVALFSLAGHFFGGHPLVKKHFSLVIMAIIVISIMPMAVAFFRQYTASRKPARSAGLPKPANQR